MDGVQMLINIIIANLIWVYLVLWVLLLYEVATMIKAQAKDGCYHN